MKSVFAPTRFALVAAALALGACDNPVQPDDDHADEIAAVEVIALNGTVLASYDTDTGAWSYTTGSNIQLNVGSQLDARVWFVGEDGDRFQLPFTGNDLTMRIVFAGGGILSTSSVQDFVRFTAGAAGATTAKIEVRHAGHADFEADGLVFQVLNVQL